MKIEIEQFNPCREALQFRQQFNSFEKAWKACPRGDWMLWIAQKLDVDLKTLTLAKGYCANTVIKLMKDKRSKNAVKLAIKFGKGLVELPELNAAYAAADAAYAAADAAAYAADAADAAYAAAYAAYAAYAADVADVAAYAANAAKVKNQKQTAKICRKYLTKAVIKKINLLS